MTVTTKIERSGHTIRAALADLSPAEGHQFESEFRQALTQAATTLDLDEADAVLTRWWGIATLRANPPTDDERQAATSLKAGNDVGWPSPAAREQARASSAP